MLDKFFVYKKKVFLFLCRLDLSKLTSQKHTHKKNVH